MRDYFPRAIRGWFVGVVLGVLPLIGHLVADFIRLPNAPSGYTKELLFLVITMSGNVFFSFFNQLFDARIDPKHVGTLAPVLLAICLVLVVVAAVAYGVITNEQDVPGLLLIAVVMVGASVVVSLWAEVRLASAALRTEAMKYAGTA